MYTAAWAQKNHCTSREYDLAHCSSFLCRLIYSVLIRRTQSLILFAACRTVSLALFIMLMTFGSTPDDSSLVTLSSLGGRTGTLLPASA